jgi:hypothetical protein
MQHQPVMGAVEWVRRVNQAWIVHSNLDQHAEAWLDYLVDLNDGRLEPSSCAARAMFRSRASLDDPKPWFYAGLFCLATDEEARRFLSNHRVTKATVPSLAGSDEVALWMDRVGDETRELIGRLRQALAEIRE